MNNLFKKIAVYKSACQALINKIEEYEEQVKENVPFELWPDFELRCFKGNQNEDWQVAINGKFIPSSPDQFGTEKYWYGDFNHLYQATNSEELLEWSKGLPQRMENMEKWVEKRIKDILDVI